MEQSSLASTTGDARLGPTLPAELAFTIGELGSLRALVARAAGEAELERERSEDLVAAVNELACNSIRHGGGSGTVRLWVQGETLLCEVSDAGHFDALTGARPPLADHTASRGLWIVRSLCDEVAIDSSPLAGSSVCVRMRLD